MSDSCFCAIPACPGDCTADCVLTQLVAGGQGREDGEVLDSAFNTTLGLMLGVACLVGFVAGMVVAGVWQQAACAAILAAAFFFGRASK